MKKSEICKLLGCTEEQLNNQYAENAKGLSQMRDKAIRTGKKVNNYTGKQLTAITTKYVELALK